MIQLKYCYKVGIKHQSINQFILIIIFFFLFFLYSSKSGCYAQYFSHLPSLCAKIFFFTMTCHQGTPFQPQYQPYRLVYKISIVFYYIDAHEILRFPSEIKKTEFHSVKKIHFTVMSQYQHLSIEFSAIINKFIFICLIAASNGVQSM